MIVPKALIQFTFILVFAQLLIMSCSAVPIQAGETAAVTESAPITVASDGSGILPPESPVKVVFIHHSTGENWLADENGGLGLALAGNNYFVSDTYYGWGPEAIGDRTDIPNWLEWFRSENTPMYTEAVFNESGQATSYSRTFADPGGANAVILFKSCFPNSNLAGSPDDQPTPGSDYTVGNAKYVYNEILQYFATRPDKLFVVITAPPVTDPTYAGNARAFNQWLVNDWLAENNYTMPNVAVFDFYTILTGPDGHHRYVDGAIQHTQGAQNTSFYPSDPNGDDHPSQAGNLRATEEFLPMLNLFYNRWAAQAPLSPPEAVQPPPSTGDQDQPPGQVEPPSSGASAGLPGILDDFEGPAPVRAWASAKATRRARTFHNAPMITSPSVSASFPRSLVMRPRTFSTPSSGIAFFRRTVISAVTASYPRRYSTWVIISSSSVEVMPPWRISDHP